MNDLEKTFIITKIFYEFEFVIFTVVYSFTRAIIS